MSTTGISLVKAEPVVPCWIEEQQMVASLPASLASRLARSRTPMLLDLDQTHAPDSKFSDTLVARPIVLPLSTDHLITLLQFNVLRSGITNRALLSSLLGDTHSEHCTPVQAVMPYPSVPSSIPPSLLPTHLQMTVPHEYWIDIVPHPQWRDNLILASGNFDEDDLWSDTVGGLFEGFPHSDIEKRGLIAWWPPWHVSGWELSEGFWKKWGWSLVGCEDVLEATNKRRSTRGEEPLVFEL
jgi:hypothetical protein